MPIVSIVLPVYNGEKYLAQSIKSVINQTFEDWELIIVNDCSNDNSPKIMRSFAKKDSRIKIINNKTNKKLPASLNIGFAAAVGKYFTWTSDDNLYKPEALEKMAQYLDTHPRADLVSMNYDFIDEQGKYINEFEDLFLCKRVVADLLQHNNVGAAFMYRKEIAEKVGQYDEFTFCAEDYDYWCRIALIGNIEYTNDNIYQYRVNSQSLSATQRPQVVEKTKYVKRKYMLDFFDKFNYSRFDRILTMLNLNIKPNSLPDSLIFSLLKIYKTTIKLLSNLIFWNRGLRCHFRKYLLIKKFSYSVRKDQT